MYMWEVEIFLAVPGEATLQIPLYLRATVKDLATSIKAITGGLKEVFPSADGAIVSIAIMAKEQMPKSQLDAIGIALDLELGGQTGSLQRWSMN